MRAALVALLGVVLLALIVTHTLVAYLADAAPETALLLSPSNPVALLNIVDRTLKIETVRRENETAGKSAAADQSRSPAPMTLDDIKKFKARAERALAAEPLSVRSIRVLGQLAEFSGESERAGTLLEIATRRSLHESVAIYYMLQHSIRAQDWPAAVSFADILMRTRLDLVGPLTPTVVKLAETPAARPLLTQSLVSNPLWRPTFLTGMVTSITDARTPLTLLLALREAGSPPTAAELGTYLRFLIDRNFHELAYYAWLQFLPPEQLAAAGLIFNGNFELPLTGYPFEWTLRSGVNVSVDIVPKPDEQGDRALRIEFGSGRVQLGIIQQRLMMGTGGYRLVGRYRGEVAGRKGLKWTLSCAGKSTRQLVETPTFVGLQRSWREFDVRFEVPATDCASQMLRLTHDATFSAEQFVTGSAWYDDLEVVRNDPR